MGFKKQFKKSYKITKKRGLINENTFADEFFNKFIEETKEVAAEYHNEFSINDFHLRQELIDVMNVCHNWMYHLNVNVKAEMKLNNKNNKKRNR